MKMSIFCFFLLYIGIVSGYVLRDLEDSYGDEVCPDEAPTIGRDIHHHYQQRCFASSDIIPTSRLIRTITVYESRNLAMKGCEGVVKVYIYDTFAEKWIDAPNFLVSGGHFLVSVTPYTRGKLYAIEFTNCWYLVKVYGMDSFRPTIIPILRSTSITGTTRDMRITTQESATTLTTTTRFLTSTGTTPRTMRSSRMTRIMTRGGITTTAQFPSTTTAIPRTTWSTTGTVKIVTMTRSQATTSKVINTTPQVIQSTTRKTVTSPPKISSMKAVTIGLGCAGGGVLILISVMIIYRRIILPRRRVDSNTGDDIIHNDRIVNHSSANSNETSGSLNDPGDDPRTEGVEMSVLGTENTEYDDVSLGSVPSRTILIDAQE